MFLQKILTFFSLFSFEEIKAEKSVLVCSIYNKKAFPDYWNTDHGMIENIAFFQIWVFFIFLFQKN